MTLADASLFSDLVGHVPTAADPIYLRFAVGGEIVRCTNFTGEVATIVRGCYSTTPATSWTMLSYTMCRPTRWGIRPASSSGAPTCTCCRPDDAIPLRVAYHKVPTVLTAGSAPSSTRSSIMLSPTTVSTAPGSGKRTWTRRPPPTPTTWTWWTGWAAGMRPGSTTRVGDRLTRTGGCADQHPFLDGL